MPGLRHRRKFGLRSVLTGWGLVLGAAGVAHGGDEVSRERIGPLVVASEGRDTVRGGRPDGATIYEVYQAPAYDPEQPARDDLRAFEQTTLAGQRPTIIDSPSEPWLARLQRPDLPVRWSPQTVAYLKYFRDDPRGQALIKGWLRRMNRYEHVLRRILREVGVPEDLVFVAMAESGFNPKVRSRVGAAGMWQFMVGTGRVYGLERDYWIDERHDLEKSTYAAAVYLKDLRVRFGSWEMALAAYNAGYGLVMTSISRANTNNFWALCQIESGLPHATTLYVPKIIAAAIVGRNRDVFHVGSELTGSLPPVEWVSLHAMQGTSLAAVAKAIDEDPALIEELNAQLVRKRVPPGRDTPLRIPRDKVLVFEREVARLADEGRMMSQHRVRHGETLAKIAQRHGTTEAVVRRINDVHNPAELEPEMVLFVPSGGKQVAVAAQRPRVAVPPLNLGPDQRLVVFEVTRASTPRSIAAAFGVPWSAVVQWNDLDPDARLQPGQWLQVAVPTSFDADVAKVVIYEADQVELVLRGSQQHLEAGLQERGLVRRGYRVRKGDDLKKIGKKFGLSDGDLARINHISRTQAPSPGTVLVVYVAKGKEKGTVAAPPPTQLPGSPEAADKVTPPSPAVSPTTHKFDEEDPTTSDVQTGDSPASDGDDPPPPQPATPSTPTQHKLPGKQGWSRPKAKK